MNMLGPDGMPLARCDTQMIEIPISQAQKITAEGIEMAAQITALQEHLAADHAALARVWELTTVWRRQIGPSITASMHQELAAEVRQAITGEETSDGQEHTG